VRNGNVAAVIFPIREAASATARRLLAQFGIVALIGGGTRPCMRISTTQEMEYLGLLDRDSPEPPWLIAELNRQLVALRRFDQCFCDADWRPHSVGARRKADRRTGP
jgi:hypothetical protein